MITVNPTVCSRCFHCVKICPSGIFRISSDKNIEIKGEHRCIRCGHCVAACGSEAIVHDVFPSERVHLVDQSQLPSPEQVSLLIRKRRSNRAFSKNPIPEEFWTTIIDAAHRAPTASNSQKVSFTLLTDPEKLKTVIEFTLDTFQQTLKRVDNFFLRPYLKRFKPDVYNYIPMFKKTQREYLEKGKDGILRGATAVILIHAPQEASFGREDCNLAYQNASLMAESLGVSQFYTGFVLRAIRQRKGKLEKILGIKGEIYAGMALGMTLFDCLNYIDRKEPTLNRY